MEFKFVDLFAGIGGFRLALEHFGGECVFSSEWDRNSQATYLNNHGDMPDGDITKIPAEEIPNHDVLTAGFPCQAFSVSGKRLGFEDSRGTLFYDVARIVKHHRPKIAFLENVKNIVSHDQGNTIRVIKQTLDDLGYNVHLKVLRSSDYGVPQARERAYFVCVRRDFSEKPFLFPERTGKVVRVRDILDDAVGDEFTIRRDDMSIEKDENSVVDPRRPLQIGRINKGGQGERIYSVHGSGVTLSAYGGGAAAKTGAYLVDGKVRKLTPMECARLQGFPISFKPHENKNIAYKQFGDSVSVPVLEAIFGEIQKQYGIGMQ
jgi:DNA (cytosine-5)-methyltransferase 1